MGPLAAYSIKSAILLSALFAVYMLTIGRQKDASMRRFTLVGICIVSILLPLFYDFGFREDTIQRVFVYSNPTPTEIMGAIPVSPIQKAITAAIVAGIYVGIVISIFGLTRLLTLRTKTVYSQGHKFRIMSDGHTSPFCFCGKIYLSEDDFSNLPGMILIHEASHITHLHFTDLFLGRTLLILQWWNPLAWIFVREVQRVHEYQADKDVLTAGYDSKEYQYLLLSRAVGDTKYGFVSGFRHRELKSRLKMLNREKKDGMRVIPLLIMVISASFIAIVLPQSPIIHLVNDKISAISLVSFHQTAEKTEIKTLDGQPHVIVDGIAMPYEAINGLNPNAIESISVWKDRPEYPYGVIEIKTKPGMDVFRPVGDSKTEEIGGIKAVSYKAERKINP